MTRDSLVGQIQRPGQKPQNAQIIGRPRPVMKAAELAAGIKSVDTRFSSEYIQVKRYGAVADGVQSNSEFDTGAARRAMDVASQHGGAKVVFEHGNYVLDTVTIDRGDMEIIGDGADITASNDLPENGAIFLSLAGGAAATTNQDILDTIYGEDVVSVRTTEPNSILNNRIRGFRFLPGTEKNIKAIWATGWIVGCAIENCTAIGFEDACIALNGCFSMTIRNNVLRGANGNGVGLDLAKSGNGVFPSGTVQCNALNIMGNEFPFSGSIGLQWAEGLGGLVVGNTFQTALTTAGAKLVDVTGITFMGNYFEINQTGTYAVIVGAETDTEAVNDSVFSGNFFGIGASASGAFQLLSAHRCTFGPNQHQGAQTKMYVTPSSYGTARFAGNILHVLEDTSSFIDESAGAAISRKSNQLRFYQIGADPTRSLISFPTIVGNGSVLTPPVTPSQITADQNNYNPGSAAKFVRLSSDASRTITGIVAATPTEGRELTIVNVGSQNIVLGNQSTSSTPENRIITGTGGDITLSADDVAELIYDSDTDRWRVLSTTGS